MPRTLWKDYYGGVSAKRLFYFFYSFLSQISFTVSAFICRSKSKHDAATESATVVVEMAHMTRMMFWKKKNPLAHPVKNGSVMNGVESISVAHRLYCEMPRVCSQVCFLSSKGVCLAEGAVFICVYIGVCSNVHVPCGLLLLYCVIINGAQTMPALLSGSEWLCWADPELLN